MVTDHLEYKKGEVLELAEKPAITLLTNGKALKIHRKIGEKFEQKMEEKIPEKTTEKTAEKDTKKSKKNE